MRRLVLLALVPLLGCSAILDYADKEPSDSFTDAPFDVTGDGDAGDVPDGDAPDVDALPDIVDDTPCDGLRVRGSVEITGSSYGAYGPTVAWTGSEFGLAWFDNREGPNEVIFTRVDTDGNKVGSDVIASDLSISSVNPSITFADSEFGLAWQDGTTSTIIAFSRIDPLGGRIGDVTEVADASSSALYPDVVWSGSQYLVAWHDNRDGDYVIYYALVNEDGTMDGGETRLTATTGEAVHASVVWAGSQYAFAWEDRRSGTQVYAARVDPSGAKLGSDVRVSTAGSPIMPSIAWSGSEIAVAFQTDWTGVSEMAMRRMNGAGEVVGTSQVQLTSLSASAENPALVWLGSSWALSWNDDRTSGDQISVGLVDPPVTGIVMDVDVTEMSTGARYPALAWTGSEIGVAWADNTSGESILSFAIVTTCP